VPKPILAGGYSLFAVLLVIGATLSYMIAVRTRALVERAARAAVAAEQAGHGLLALLRDHHDLRTVLSSVQINADLLARSASSHPVLGETIDRLQEDLAELRQQLDEVKGRALEKLAGLEERRAVAADQAVAEVVAALAPRFPGVTIAADAAPGRVLVSGGERALRRMVANLVANACEGDGVRAAHRVDVRVRFEAAGRVAIEVSDDGPGLPAHVLAAAPGEAVSTKPEGTGIGLGLVDGLVRASGGTLAWRNGETGGARVVVELPAAP
jgi:signal transduction histidine kinase